MTQPQQSMALLRRWGLTRHEQAINLQDEAITFYSLMTLADRDDPIQRADTDEIFSQMARTFFNAMVCACAGEARYEIDLFRRGMIYAIRMTKARKSVDGPFVETVEEQNARMTLFGPKWMYSRPFGLGEWFNACDSGIFSKGSETGRTEAAQVFKDIVWDKYGDVHATRILRNLFRTRSWHINDGRDDMSKSPAQPSNTGGGRWSYVAKIAHMYAKGKLSDVIFLDTVFNLQHNNSSLFTKTHATSKAFATWLDNRRAGDEEWITRQAPAWVLAKYAGERPDAIQYSCSLLVANAYKPSVGGGFASYDEPREPEVVVKADLTVGTEKIVFETVPTAKHLKSEYQPAAATSIPAGSGSPIEQFVDKFKIAYYNSNPNTDPDYTPHGDMIEKEKVTNE
jgi:hypothetical protein